MSGLPSTPATALPMSGLSWFAVEAISSLPLFDTSQTQPLPKRPMPAASNFALNSSKLPNVALMSSASLPVGAPPAPGARIFQKNEWFQWPPPLLRTGPRIASGTTLRSLMICSSDLASSAALPAMALLRLSTYAL